IQIAHSADHRFLVGMSTMVGQLVTLSYGVRTLFVEAGWPRVPRDGFVRGGGLACANIRHLGIRAASEELVLAKTNNGTPNWKSLTKQRPSLQQSDIHHHISILLDRPR
ncbi:MAG TPA: hypothetical protein VFB65_23820, partial [Pyrinomonadaceae bacterium]|nr:hypothetical protein [Pyrinomonadaceae bacterium]